MSLEKFQYLCFVLFVLLSLIQSGFNKCILLIVNLLGCSTLTAENDVYAVLDSRRLFSHPFS